MRRLMTDAVPPPPPAFHVDDWVYFEFTLGQVREMEEGRVTRFSDGSFSTGGYDLSNSCVPLSTTMKLIAEVYAAIGRRIHEEGSPGLNFPDIHRWLVGRWRMACYEFRDPAQVQTRYDEARRFLHDILDKQEIDSGYGFPLLRTVANGRCAK
jgi:hypothetical protein